VCPRRNSRHNLLPKPTLWLAWHQIPTKALTPLSASFGRSYLERDTLGRKPHELAAGFVFRKPVKKSYQSVMTTKDYDSWDKSRLIDELKRLSTRKKYGLVWEERPEAVVEKCKTELPVLEEVSDRALEADASLPTNLLIEGDNYHALSVLNYTHAGKIDLIYIDPPYNTGAKDWKYNNHFVDENDTYRHSKWLSMMNSRLRLAKKLLAKNGVLICTIDKYEVATLKLLIDDLFPEYEVVIVTIVHNPAGTQGKNFSYTNEFALFVFPNDGGRYIGETQRDQELVSSFRDWGTISKRDQAKTCFYPIFVKDNEIIGFGEVCKDDFHPKLANVQNKDGSIAVYPIDAKGVERKWVFSRNSVVDIKNELFCKKTKGEISVFRKKNTTSHKTVWDNKKYYANIYGSKLLNTIIDTKFPFPKSLHAVEDCINAVIHQKESAMILDFFAGSGTTGHAVLELNKNDGGTRTFILCTNNENGIAEEVTYPRIKNVIEGYGKKKGITANLRYFKTDFIEKSNVSDDTRRNLVKKSTEMICVKESTFKKSYDNQKFKIYHNSSSVTGILFDLDAVDEFKEKLEKAGLPSSIYVFSLTNDVYDEDFIDLNVKHSLKPIPEGILEVYRKVFA